MSISFSFDKLGNEYPSESERLILQAAIERDENRLKPIQEDLIVAEEQFTVSQESFQLAESLLMDATLRVQTISSTIDATNEALRVLELSFLSDEEQARLDNAPTKGVSHLSIARKVVKQQETTKKNLSKRIFTLEAALIDAEAALAKERVAISVAEVQLCGSEEDLRMLKDQYAVVDASIKARRNRFSAIRKVPIEVWTQIFQFTVSSPQQAHLKSLSPKAVVNPARPLRQVCQRWSRVLRKIPSLWGHLYIKGLALGTSSHDFIKDCLLRSGNALSVLYVRTLVGQVSQARSLVASLKGSIIEEVQIHVTQDSIKAGECLIANLPTPVMLSIYNEINELQPKHKILMLKAVPHNASRLNSISMKNGAFLVPLDISPDSTPITQKSVRHLTISVTKPKRITSLLGDYFSNMETLHLGGIFLLRDPDLKVTFKFPRLRHLTGPLSGLVLTFDDLCKLPALSNIGTWVDDGGVPEMTQWFQFLRRDGLRNRLSSVKIYDMEEKNAKKMGKYIQRIGSFPSLTLMGRSVDVLARSIFEPNAGACKLNLQSIIVEAYSGDGSSILELVNAYTAAPAALAIQDVTWVECCNVNLQTRMDVEDHIRQGDSEANLDP